jgi:hypothetical protein
MDETESELQEALIARVLLSYPEGVIHGLAQMAWDRLVASGKLYNDKASEKEVPMSLVIGTVGTIDPMSVCEDASCGQRGELMKDHQVTHKNKETLRGKRGECEHCHGRMHNTNDAGQLIAFQCLWRQAFGEDARTNPVNATSLAVVAAAMNGGAIPRPAITGIRITGWADRASLHTAVAAPPKAGPAAMPATLPFMPTPVFTLVGGPGLIPSIPKGPAPVVSDSPPQPGIANSTAPVGTEATTPSYDPAAIAKKRAALQAALKGARVQP